MQLTLLIRLFRRKHSYHFLIVYVLALTVASFLETTTYIARNAMYSQFYWIDEIVMDALGFALVLSFIARALKGHPARFRVLTSLVGTAVLVVTFSALILHGSAQTVHKWMPLVVRNVAFFTAILNLVLWFMIVGKRNHSLQFLLISGAFGIKTTGEAIGYSLNVFLHSSNTIWVPNVVFIATHMLALYVWWKALDIKDRTPARVAEATV